MKENRNKISNFPNLRFREFQGENNNSYKKYFFEDIFLFSTGKNIKQNEASPEFETPCVRYGELYHLYNEVITNVVNKTNLDTSELRFSDGNEILLPSAGEDPLDIGSASALTVKNVAIGRTINILKPAKADVYSPIYVSYYINQKLRKPISALAKGVSISNVYNSDLKTLKITLPSLSEQNRIADFLTKINLRISTQIQIIEELELLMKGLILSFIRKKEKNIQLKDCLNCHSSTLMESAVIEKNGIYPVYGATGVIAHTSNYEIDKDAILIIKDGSGVGKVQYAKDKYSVIGTLNYLTPKENVSLKYLYYYLRAFNFDKYKVGSGIPHIYFKDYRNEYIYCPPIEKQNKIANFLSAIDQKLETEKQILKKYTEQKKYLLANMFV